MEVTPFQTFKAPNTGPVGYVDPAPVRFLIEEDGLGQRIERHVGEPDPDADSDDQRSGRRAEGERPESDLAQQIPESDRKEESDFRRPLQDFVYEFHSVTLSSSHRRRLSWPLFSPTWRGMLVS